MALNRAFAYIRAKIGIKAEPLVYSAGSVVSVGATSTALVAAQASGNREVLLIVRTSAVHLGFGAAATTAGALLPPGAYVFSTLQAINAIRAASASANASVSALVGT